MNTPVLVADQLRFRYPSQSQPVIDGLSIVVRPGEMVSISGPSGSGKSTLLYLVGLLLQPGSGKVILAGVDTTRLSDHGRSLLRAHSIGFVLQDAALHHHLTILENVAEGALYSGANLASARDRAAELLDAFGLTREAALRPAQVSGGQGQRAALCRALIRRPSIILADEPTGNLDADNADHVLVGLRSAAEAGAGVLVVTHAASVAVRCDRELRL